MESNDKRVYAGYYKRYDGQLIYVISTAKDADTGEDTVIYMPYSLTKKYGYFTVSKRSLTEKRSPSTEDRHRRHLQLMFSIL